MNKSTKFALLAACMGISIYSAAQTFTSAGTLETGGDITFSSQSYSYNTSIASNDITVTTFSFNPYLGYMVSDGLELGFLPGIGISSSTGGSSTNLNLFFAPSYNFNLGSMVYPYIELLVGYNSSSYNASGNGGYSEPTASGMGIGVDGGLKLNLKGNSLLLFRLQYLHQSYERPAFTYSASSYTPFPVTVPESETIINNISFGMGVRIFFERKAKKK